MASSSEHPELRLRYAAVSDLGRHRKENQDSGYAGDHLLVVADGVGGAAYGDVASATAVHLLRRLDAAPTEEMLPALAGAMHRIHDRLAEMVEHDHELEGTSTTVTAAMFDGHRLGFAHVGDSRAYLLHEGAITQVTKDHTFVQTLVDEGRITEEDSRVHPHRNIILRAVDGVHETEPDLFHVDVVPGDRLLLCSDGCSGVLTDAQLAAILAEGTIDSAAVDLVQASLDGGTTDNVTVIVAEVVPAGEPEAAGSAMAATGPMLVGAAAAQPRRGGMLSRALFRGRQSDTGELEPVPAADAEVDPEELRYAPRPPRRHPLLRRILFVLVPVLVAVAALGWAYSWSQRQYYVAVDGPYVAIYQGVQLDLPGIDLSSLEQTSEVKVDDLSPFNQQKVEAGIVAESLSDARTIVENLAAGIADCPSPSPTPSPSRTPTKAPSRTPTASPGTSPGPTPTTKAAKARAGTATASPTPTPGTDGPTPRECVDPLGTGSSP